LAKRTTTEEELARVNNYEHEDFSAEEKAVLGFTDHFYKDHLTIPQSVWDDLRAHYDEPQIIEITWTVSSYIMLGKLIYAFQIPFGDKS
jgi:alkylhydroperoxidase family enzyme